MEWEILEKEAIEHIMSRYTHATSFQRWHMRGRLALCPFEALLKHLTADGNLLDVGCGFGHFAWFLRSTKKKFAYFGTDIDPTKISLAKSSLDNAANRGEGRPDRALPEFRLGDALALKNLPESFNNIVFLDVLYLLPWEKQVQILEWAFNRLSSKPNSVLVIKTMDEAKGFSGLRAVLEEWIMVRLLHRTLSSGAINGARSASDYLEIAHSLGFHGIHEQLGTFNPSSLLIFRRKPI